jgi:microcompartment protein CcmK/EutM
VFLGRVAGDLTSTCKHRALEGARLLWVERTGPGGEPLGRRARRILALDQVDAGPGDLVLVLDEGNGAAQVLGRSRGPVRTVIVGVVDRVSVEAAAAADATCTAAS